MAKYKNKLVKLQSEKMQKDLKNALDLKVQLNEFKNKVNKFKNKGKISELS